MIGNDIIDLKKARGERKAENQRYIEKAFSPREAAMIKNSEDPEALFWQFWSMKETAYKSHQRLFNLPQRLNPKSFECIVENNGENGIVKVDLESYSVQVNVTSNFIHCQTSKFDTYNKVYSYNSESKQKMLLCISEIYNLPASEISIFKDKLGIPHLNLNNLDKNLPVSISHHGGFFSFCIPLINC